MRPSSHLTRLFLWSAVLAACAPGAWSAERGFEAWFAQLGAACEGKEIGGTRVEDLVRGSTRAAIYFTNQTSRLYRGRLKPDSWATGVSASLNGWRTDPGIRCVLERYDEYREKSPPGPRY